MIWLNSDDAAGEEEPFAVVAEKLKSGIDAVLGFEHIVRAGTADIGHGGELLRELSDHVRSHGVRKE
ncbi:hypothetical protein GCM10025780_07820 [Frondihabitans cladoniiphilus]|uniref:Uncharacterized protein n=1 Tax=Frondihabitans cladoniiphilus TaxID=715785 RepID=A0ABP8VNW7_9MICO